jgi:hypothetical protein
MKRNFGLSPNLPPRAVRILYKRREQPSSPTPSSDAALIFLCGLIAIGSVILLICGYIALGGAIGPQIAAAATESGSR